MTGGGGGGGGGGGAEGALDPPPPPPILIMCIKYAEFILDTPFGLGIFSALNVERHLNKVVL